MGVMRCNRYDCESVMCKRYSPKYGYICDTCFDELVDYLARKGLSPERVETFMGRATKSGLLSKETVRTALEDVFEG